MVWFFLFFTPFLFLFILPVIRFANIGSQFLDPVFYEARAVVLSNMGQHKQALEIYVFKMEDYGKAEEYASLHSFINLIS